MVRCFIGILIPEELKKPIKNIQDRFKNLPMSCKLVESTNLHVSLSFLGEIEENKIEEVKRNLDLICSEFRKFKVTISGLKTIPSKTYIRVLALELYDKEKNLEEISKKIKEKIGGDVKPPHLTLARVKNISNKQKILEELEKMERVELGDFLMSSIQLIKSELRRTGPVYLTLHESRLRD